MTQAGQITPRLIKQFLLTAYKLRNSQHAEGLISMDMVGHQMALLKEEEDKTDRRDLLKQITKLHISLGHLAREPNTEEVGLFRFTPKGLAMAQQWLKRETEFPRSD
jgi:hypothetical protein